MFLSNLPGRGWRGGQGRATGLPFVFGWCGVLHGMWPAPEELRNSRRPPHSLSVFRLTSLLYLKMLFAGVCIEGSVRWGLLLGLACSLLICAALAKVGKSRLLNAHTKLLAGDWTEHAGSPLGHGDCVAAAGRHW